MRSISIPVAFAMALAMGAAEVRAQGDPDRSLEGNWFVQAFDYPKKGQVKRWAATITRPWKQENVGNPATGYRTRVSRVNDGPWKISLGDYSKGWSAGGTQELEIGNRSIKARWFYFVYGHWGGWSQLSQGDRDTLRGRWWYGDEGGGEIWKRAQPRIERVVFKSGVESVWRPGGPPARVEGKWDGFWWGPQNGMPGNRPTFKVHVYGENFWGSHHIDLGEAVSLEPMGQRYMQTDQLNTGNPNTVTGVEFSLVLWDHVKPGSYVVRVNGVKIPFDLVIHGFPKDAELRDAFISPGMKDPFDVPDDSE